MPDENNIPLFLPPGSIRAILALGVTFTVCYSYLTIGQIPTGLSELAFLAWGIYFGQRIKGG